MWTLKEMEDMMIVNFFAKQIKPRHKNWTQES